MINAKDLKKKALKHDRIADHLEWIEDKVTNAAESGETSAIHYLNGNDQHLYDQLADTLREHGYSVSWNGACLWMEISWD